MSLRWRLALILGVLVAGAVALVATASYVSTREQLEQGIDDFLQNRADELIRAERRRGRNNPPPPAVPGSVSQQVGPDGEVTDSGTADGDAAITLPVDEADLAIAAGEATARYRNVRIEGVDYRMLTVPDQNGALQVARDTTEMEDAVDGLRNRLLVVGTVGTALAVVIGWLVAWRFTRPIEQLTAASEKVASTQDLAHPIEVDRSDEVGRLADSFNAMLRALDDSRRQQEQLVMDASHELRTPLTTLRTNIELLHRATDLPADERQDLLAAATVELEELTALVTELVDLATDATAREVGFEDVDLGRLVTDVVERGRHRTGREITLDLHDSATVRGAPTLLTRAVSNLIDNADKFAPDDTRIDVVVHGSTISVTDQGPGIPDEEQERVFDRFYRTDAARTLPGSGLGLAIVRQVVTQHGGTVSVEQAPEGGARFTIRLGASPDDSGSPS